MTVKLPSFRALGRPLVLLGFLTLAACATPAPYAPMMPGQATGYTDRQISENRWRVTFTGNSVTPREMVETALLRRAAEVTLAAGRTNFMFDTRDTRARTRYDAIPTGPGFGYGYGFGYWGFRPHWGFYGAMGPEVDIVSTTKYESYAEIVLLTADQARSEPRALDARDVLAHMAPLPPPPPPRT